jgi:hypothetical protein
MRVATRSFIEAGSSLVREPIAFPKDRVAAGALPLKTVYALAATTRFSLRFYDLPAIDNCGDLLDGWTEPTPDVAQYVGVADLFPDSTHIKGSRSNRDG